MAVIVVFTNIILIARIVDFIITIIILLGVIIFGFHAIHLSPSLAAVILVVGTNSVIIITIFITVIKVSADIDFIIFIIIDTTIFHAIHLSPSLAAASFLLPLFGELLIIMMIISIINTEEKWCQKPVK